MARVSRNGCKALAAGLGLVFTLGLGLGLVAASRAGLLGLGRYTRSGAPATELPAIDSGWPALRSTEFSAQEVEGLRRVAQLTDQLPELAVPGKQGWRVSDRDPENVVALFHELRIRSGLALRAYEFVVGADRWSRIYSLPEGAALAEPLGTGEPPQPPGGACRFHAGHRAIGNGSVVPRSIDLAARARGVFGEVARPQLAHGAGHRPGRNLSRVQAKSRTPSRRRLGAAGGSWSGSGARDPQDQRLPQPVLRRASRGRISDRLQRRVDEVRPPRGLWSGLRHLDWEQPWRSAAIRYEPGVVVDDVEAGSLD